VFAAPAGNGFLDKLVGEHLALVSYVDAVCLPCNLSETETLLCLFEEVLGAHFFSLSFALPRQAGSKVWEDIRLLPVAVHSGCNSRIRPQLFPTDPRLLLLPSLAESSVSKDVCAEDDDAHVLGMQEASTARDGENAPSQRRLPGFTG